MGWPIILYMTTPDRPTTDPRSAPYAGACGVRWGVRWGSPGGPLGSLPRGSSGRSSGESTGGFSWGRTGASESRQNAASLEHRWLLCARHGTSRHAKPRGDGVRKPPRPGQKIRKKWLTGRPKIIQNWPFLSSELLGPESGSVWLETSGHEFLVPPQVVFPGVFPSFPCVPGVGGGFSDAFN
jgi:hypothetical protein